jgi:hypothetical protein
MTMNMNSLVSCFRASLGGFFEFCEEQNGVKADDLNNLFNQYFAIDGSVTPKVKPAEKAWVKKAASKKTVRELSDSDDEDMSVSPKKAPVKKTTRKPSGKDTKSRDKQTPVNDIDLNKKKLPELKEYARERGLPTTSTKAQIIENILNYEKMQEASSAVTDNKIDSEEDLGIQIKKPNGKKTCESIDMSDYEFEIEEKHGLRMIACADLDGWFVLNDKDVIIGWVCRDDEAFAEDDEPVNVRALDKDVCEVAKRHKLEFEVPENLDA